MEDQSVLTEDLNIGDLFKLCSGTEVASDLKAGLGAEELGALRKALPKMISWSSVRTGLRILARQCRRCM